MAIHLTSVHTICRFWGDEDYPENIIEFKKDLARKKLAVIVFMLLKLNRH